MTAEIDPTQPTDALPGSKEKILVLTVRASALLPLFLPGDNKTLPNNIEEASKAKPAGHRWLKGVSYNKAKKAFVARMPKKLGGKVIGLFDTELIASRAYNLAIDGKMDEARKLIRQRKKA